MCLVTGLICVQSVWNHMKKLTWCSCRWGWWPPAGTGTGWNKVWWDDQRWRWPWAHTDSWRAVCRRSCRATTTCTDPETQRSRRLRSERAAWHLETEHTQIRLVFYSQTLAFIKPFQIYINIHLLCDIFIYFIINYLFSKG